MSKKGRSICNRLIRKEQITSSDEMDDLYDFHAQMVVHEEAPMEVQVIQPQMEQQQPHPSQEP
jgi:hypothetical protein